jgi:hypothetical protein
MQLQVKEAPEIHLTRFSSLPFCVSCYSVTYRDIWLSYDSGIVCVLGNFALYTTVRSSKNFLS